MQTLPPSLRRPLSCLVVWMTVLGASGGLKEARGAPLESPPADDFHYAHNPLHPLWEGTGYALDRGEAYVGSAFLQVGLVERVQVGLRPLSYFFRAPNAHVKWEFLRRGPLSLAVQLEGLMLLKGASESFTSSNFVSRLDNTESDLGVVPLSTSVSWAARPWLNLHATATALTVFGGQSIRTQETFGLTGAAELAAHAHHSLFFHGGEVGFWNHDFAYFGASYRYHRNIFEARLGYFFRFTEDGRQGAPLLALGVKL